MESSAFQPDVVSVSRQTEPPTVTWPVWNSKRGETTRTNGGAAG